MNKPNEKKIVKILCIIAVIAGVISLLLGGFAFVYNDNLWFFFLGLLIAIITYSLSFVFWRLNKQMEKLREENKLNAEVLDNLLELSSRPSVGSLKFEEMQRKAEEKRKEEERLAQLREEQDIRDFREKIIKKYQNALDDTRIPESVTQHYEGDGNDLQHSNTRRLLGLFAFCVLLYRGGFHFFIRNFLCLLRRF